MLEHRLSSPFVRPAMARCISISPPAASGSDGGGGDGDDDDEQGDLGGEEVGEGRRGATVGQREEL